MNKKKTRLYSLFELTGLTEDVFATVLSKNPRAYMAVKGAVAEEHLARILDRELNSGNIKRFKTATSDSDKDFYVTLNNGLEVIVECKNVEVIKINRKADIIRFLIFLLTHEYVDTSELKKRIEEGEVTKRLDVSELERRIDLDQTLNSLTGKELKALLRRLPRNLTQSGIPRYEFSADLVANRELTMINASSYLSQFAPPLSIDFQRTRNAIVSSDEHPKAQRFYKVGEVDVVAACLFSRTLRWEFVFCNAANLPRHERFPARYSNRLVLNPDFWSAQFSFAA